MGFCATGHLQASGRLVQELNACTVLKETTCLCLLTQSPTIANDRLVINNQIPVSQNNLQYRILHLSIRRLLLYKHLKNNMSENKPSAPMTHEACKYMVSYEVWDLWSHQYPGNWVATGRAVVYHAQAATGLKQV